MNTRDQEPLTPEERELAQRLSRLDAHASPSAALDAKILAAARSPATGAGADAAPAPAGPRRPRWPVGLGIAASLLVAVGIAWQLRPQPDTGALPAPSEVSLPQADSAGPASAGLMTDAPDAGTPADAPETASDTARSAAPPSARAAASAAVAVAPEAERERASREASAAAALAEREAAAAREAAVREPVAREAAPSAGQRQAAPSPSTKIVFDQAPSAPKPPPAAPSPQITAEPAFVPAPPPAAATQIARPDATARERASAVPAPAPTAAGKAAAARRQVDDDSIATGGTHAASPTGGEALDGARPQPPLPDEAPLNDPLLDDQPLDDRPPASAGSPEVREHWLQRIRELRDAGELDAARASLREFVRRHPRAEVPADLRPLLPDA